MANLAHLLFFFSETTKPYLVSEKQRSVKRTLHSAVEKRGSPRLAPSPQDPQGALFLGKCISEFPAVLLIRQRGHVAL